MKTCFFLLLLLATSQFITSQENIIGTWKIDYLVGLYYNQPEDHQEYNLFPINKKENRGYDSGNWIQFNKDETFNSYYTAPCGNDCFPSVFGRFKLLDSDRVLLHIDSIHISGFCESKQSYPNKDLGIFKIFAEKSGLRLIKSGTDEESDSAKLTYSHLIDSFEWDGINGGKVNQLEWITLKSNQLKDLLEGLSKVSGYDVKKVNILYSKQLAANKVILFEYEGEKRLVFYAPNSRQFAIYDGSIPE